MRGLLWWRESKVTSYRKASLYSLSHLRPRQASNNGVTATTDATTTAAFPPITPPRPPAHVVPTLFNQEHRNWEDSKERFYCFLATTKRAESPSSLLGSDHHDLNDILKHIFGFVKFTPMSITDESKYYYKVKMLLCRSTAYVSVDALANNQQGRVVGPYWELNHTSASTSLEPRNDEEFCGVLIRPTSLGETVHEHVIAHLAQLRNDHEQDGSYSSYYTEGQLRSYWRNQMYGLCAVIGMAHCMGSTEIFAAAAALFPTESMRPSIPKCEFCEGTISDLARPPLSLGEPPPAPTQFHSFHCNQLCMALPGDSIYWKFLDAKNRIVVRWETATDEDLVERGHVEPGMIGRQGHLFAMCQAYRQRRRTGY